VTYIELTEKYYTGHKEYNKAMAAAKAMDNSLKKEYTIGGVTNTHFMASNFNKYFAYEKLPCNRK